MNNGETPGKPARRPAPTREERLAAKLRENLHRRKAQARQGQQDGDDAESVHASGGKPALPKSPPNS